MKVWRLGDSENFIGKGEELVFHAFRDFEPVERAYDKSDMTGLRSLNVKKNLTIV